MRKEITRIPFAYGFTAPTPKWPYKKKNSDECDVTFDERSMEYVITNYYKS